MRKRHIFVAAVLLVLGVTGVRSAGVQTIVNCQLSIVNSQFSINLPVTPATPQKSPSDFSDGPIGSISH